MSENLPRVFREGRTFAERKAARAARGEDRTPTPRLASLGPSEFVQRGKGGALELIPCELFVDVDKPARMFAQLPDHSHLVPMFDDRAKTDTTTPLPPLPAGRRRLSKPDTGREPSPPGHVTPISGSENPLWRATP